jgi:hypothetical protein
VLRHPALPLALLRGYSVSMHPATMRAFRDELTKISGSLSVDINKKFGLPLHPTRPNTRRYDPGPSSASSADRSQSPIAGQATANISSSNQISPATGPGGV